MPGWLACALTVWAMVAATAGLTWVVLRVIRRADGEGEGEADDGTAG